MRIGSLAANLGALFVSCALAGGAIAAPELRPYDTHFLEPFFGDFGEEARSAADEHKGAIFVLYELEDCPVCARFHAQVLNRRAVQDYYRSRFALFGIDIHGAMTVVDFQGQAMTEKEFAAGHGVVGAPTSVFYSLEGAEIARFRGAPESVEQFLLLGRYVQEGAYRRMEFARYEADHARR